MIYETKKDWDAQKEIARRFAEARNLCYAVFRRSEDKRVAPPFDVMFFDNDTVDAVGEIKSRKIAIDTYQTVIVDYEKLARLSRRAFEYGVRPVFIVRFEFDDKIGWWQFPTYDAPAKLHRMTGGRTRNPRDLNDIDLVAHVPIDYFEILNEGETK